MRKFAYALLLARALSITVSAGEPAGRELSPQDTDRAINAVFNGAQGVVRMEADLVSHKTGGMVRGAQTVYEFLRL